MIGVVFFHIFSLLSPPGISCPNLVAVDELADRIVSLVPSPAWPVYSNDAPCNYVYDTNLTALAYLEPDTFRAEAIDYFNENFGTLLGR
jgi:hypothetical protein